MGEVIIQKETTRDPISLIGREAALCWGGDIADKEKNRKRGLDCLKSEHGRTWEFPQIYVYLKGYSARVIREFYTHIGGMSTRLQASTRYINYKDFAYVTPASIELDAEKKETYERCMNYISASMELLETLNAPREDIAMLLPLGMKTEVICRMNLRTLIDMTKQRACSRAYVEFRELIQDIWSALDAYGDYGEWSYLKENYDKPKCDFSGFCTERYGCGRMPKKDEARTDLHTN